MSFIAKVSVTCCENCPYKKSVQQGASSHYECPELKGTWIAYQGILENCPYNKPDLDVMPLSDYVASRQLKENTNA